MERAIARMHTPPHAQHVERSCTTMTSIPIQTETTQVFGTWGGEPTAQGSLGGTSIDVTRTNAPGGPSEPKIRS